MKSKYSKTTRQLLDEIRQNQLDETITAVKNKAKKTGMPYSILKKVYDRGMAAWKGGHRPGATQVQWALARVNSFVTKSSGTWGGADKDLAKKVRAAEGFEFSVCEKCGGEECVCEEFEKENLDEGTMRVSGIKYGSHNEYFKGVIKKELPNLVAKSSPNTSDVITFSGSKSDLQKLADIAKKRDYRVGDIKEELEEGKMSEIDRMSKDGKSAEEIAKALKLDVKAVKSVLGEADLSKKQIKMVHKVADDLPKKGFKDRYGKDKGDAVRFGTATNMVKKKLGIDEEEDINELTVSMDKVNKAQKIAKKFAGNMTKAVAEIEKIAKGLSDMSFVKQALAKYNEDLEKDDEKQVKDVIKGLKKGSALHAKQAKELEKQIADEVELEESSWEKNKDILPPHLKKLFDKDGNLKNPRSQAVFDKMIKDAGGPAGFIKKHKLREDISEAGPCWKGFKQVGMKKKGGKMVPNCVPTEDTDYDFKVLDLEDLDENLDVRYDIKKQGWFDKQGKRRYLGIGQTNALMKKALDKAKRTGDFINPFKMTHGQKAEDLEERFPRKGDYAVHSQKKGTPIKNIDHFATKQDADDFAAKVKKDGGKVSSITKLEDLDAQPQDKDVKKVKGTQPKKYYKDLKKDTKKKRANFFKNRPGYKKSDDDDDYKAAPGDKEAKTKPSTFTKKFKKMYGEEVLNEFTAAQIKTLEREYAPLKGKRMSVDQLNKMTGMIKKMSKDQLNKLAQASIPFVTSTAKSELVINRGMKWTDFKEDINEDVEEVVKLKAEIEKLTREKEELEKRAAAASQDKSAPIPNPDTGEVPLKVGLAQAILKLKKDAREADKKMKMTGKKIMQMAKEHFMMEDVSDQAKALGLDYMNFGRYGKDGKVTHKSMGGKLQPVKGKDDKKSDKKSKDSDDESPEAVDKKARKFMSDLEKGNLEDEDGFGLELDFEDEMSFEPIQDKARELGLDDVVQDLEDVGSYVAEMEPEKAEAEFRKVVAKYSGKPDRAVEMAKKSSEAIDMMTDTEYDMVQPFLSDLNMTMDMLKKAVNSDKTSKGFNPEVIDALQNTREIIGDLRDFAEVGDEDDQELFDQLDGEIEYMADDSEDHDEYTKQSKVISSVETAQKIIKKLIKRTKDYEIKEATNIAKKEDESQVLTFRDLKKKLDISDIQKILPDKKKKEMKLSKEKTKIKIDPEMDISPSAGGNAQAASNN